VSRFFGFFGKEFSEEYKSITNQSLERFEGLLLRSGDSTEYSIEREQLFHLAGELELSNQSQSEG